MVEREIGIVDVQLTKAAAAAVWCCHVYVDQNLWGMFPAPCRLWLWQIKAVLKAKGIPARCKQGAHNKIISECVVQWCKRLRERKMQSVHSLLWRCSALPKDGAGLSRELNSLSGRQSCDDWETFGSSVTRRHPAASPESNTVTWVSACGACSELTKEWGLVMVIDRSKRSRRVLCPLFITARRLFMSSPRNPIQPRSCIWSRAPELSLAAVLKLAYWPLWNAFWEYPVFDLALWGQCCFRSSGATMRSSRRHHLACLCRKDLALRPRETCLSTV